MSQKNKVPEIVLKALKQSLSMDSKSRGERNRDGINALCLTGGPWDFLASPCLILQDLTSYTEGVYFLGQGYPAVLLLSLVHLGVSTGWVQAAHKGICVLCFYQLLWPHYIICYFTLRTYFESRGLVIRRWRIQQRAELGMLSIQSLVCANGEADR